MAVDKLVDSVQLDADLTSVADAIRAKTGKSASMQFPGEFVSEIGSISGGVGVPHVETIDYTPTVNTQALSIPLSFTNVPLCIYIYLDTVPSSHSVATVYSIRLLNMHASIDDGTVTLSSVSRKTYDLKADGVYDYWTSTPDGTIAKDMIDISVANRSLYFGAGLTYHIIAVEVVT